MDTSNKKQTDTNKELSVELLEYLFPSRGKIILTELSPAIRLQIWQKLLDSVMPYLKLLAGFTEAQYIISNTERLSNFGKKGLLFYDEGLGERSKLILIADSYGQDISSHGRQSRTISFSRCYYLADSTEIVIMEEFTRWPSRLNKHHTVGKPERLEFRLAKQEEILQMVTKDATAVKSLTHTLLKMVTDGIDRRENYVKNLRELSKKFEHVNRFI